MHKALANSSRRSGWPIWGRVSAVFDQVRGDVKVSAAWRNIVKDSVVVCGKAID